LRRRPQPDFPREIAQAARDFRQPVGVGNDVVEKFSLVPVGHQGRRRRVDIVAQKLRGPLNRGQRRFQFMRYMGGEGRDEAGARIQPSCHFQKTLRQAGELAGAVALERAQRIAVALADQIGSFDQLPHRLGDGAMKQKSDQQGRNDHGEHREHESSAPLIQVFEDVAGRARRIDDACDLIAHDHGHRGKDAHAGAPADRIERRLVML
jgi:hypothetical protein